VPLAPLAPTEGSASRHRRQTSSALPPLRRDRGALRASRMLIFTEVRAVWTERDVMAVYRNEALGGYCKATVITASGEEISGYTLVAAIVRIEREIADHLLRPNPA
jgi:hypothetical protein